VMLAEAYAALGDEKGTKDALLTVEEGGLGREVPAVLASLAIGDRETAKGVAEAQSRKLQSHSRAYGRMIEGLLQLESGDKVAAIDSLRASIEFADLWLIRFELGKAYLEAGFAAEAMDELQICNARIGEATSLFLDDRPTWRYTATLPYWFGRAEEALGMSHAAKEKYRIFLQTRSEGPLADDARGRL